LAVRFGAVDGVGPESGDACSFAIAGSTVTSQGGGDEKCSTMGVVDLGPLWLGSALLLHSICFPLFVYLP